MRSVASPPLEVRDLTKFYGASRGVEGVSFDVGAGEIVGFLGPNGSGKTTVLRTVTGLISITRGSAHLFGEPVSKRSDSLRASIGYLPGTLGLYQNLTVSEYLSFIARMRGIRDMSYANQLCERLDLGTSLHISALSKGTRQKVGVVQAFMHRPRLLLLDEPTSGLDPLVQREFKAILDEVVGNGSAVLLSSHVLTEVEQLASRVAVLDRGSLIAVDTVASLKERTAHTIEFHFDSPVDPGPFLSCTGVSSAEARDSTVVCVVVGSQTDVLTLAVARGARRVVSPEPTLEEIFFSLTRGRDSGGERGGAHG